MLIIIEIAQDNLEVFPSGRSMIKHKDLDTALDHWSFLKRDPRSKKFVIRGSDGTIIDQIIKPNLNEV